MSVNREQIGKLLDALEIMANDAGRRGLDMHPSRHDQAVDRVMDMFAALEAENAEMRPLWEMMKLPKFTLTKRPDGWFFADATVQDVFYTASSRTSPVHALERLAEQIELWRS